MAASSASASASRSATCAKGRARPVRRARRRCSCAAQGHVSTAGQRPTRHFANASHPTKLSNWDLPPNRLTWPVIRLSGHAPSDPDRTGIPVRVQAQHDSRPECRAGPGVGRRLGRRQAERADGEHAVAKVAFGQHRAALGEQAVRGGLRRGVMTAPAAPVPMPGSDRATVCSLCRHERIQLGVGPARRTRPDPRAHRRLPCAEPGSQR